MYVWDALKDSVTITEHVWITNFRGRELKNFQIPWNFVFLRGPTTWKVIQRNVWSDIVSWQQDDATTLRSVYSMDQWPPLQRRRNKICWRIVKQYVLKLLCVFSKVMHLFRSVVDVCETNFSFTPFNRIRNLSLDEIRRDSLSRCVGSDWFSLWKHNSDFWQRSKISRNDQRFELYSWCSLKRPIFASTRTHRVALDWLFDRINLDSKIQIKSNTSTPKTISQTYWPRETSHVMSGIICCLCSTFAIPVPQCVLKQWRKNFNEIQEKNESQQNRHQWWALLPGRRRSYCLQLQWARRRNITEFKIHGNQLLEKIDQGDLVEKQIYLKPLIIITMSNSWSAYLQQIIQNWMMTVLALLKSGKLRLRHTIDQGDLIKLLGEWYEKFDLITRKFFSTEPRNP